MTRDARKLYWQGVADGRAQGEELGAPRHFWRGFVVGAAVTLLWVALVWWLLG